MKKTCLKATSIVVGGGVVVCVRDGAGQTMLGIFVAVARVPVQLVVQVLSLQLQLQPQVHLYCTRVLETGGYL